MGKVVLLIAPAINNPTLWHHSFVVVVVVVYRGVVMEFYVFKLSPPDQRCVAVSDDGTFMLTFSSQNKTEKQTQFLNSQYLFCTN